MVVETAIANDEMKTYTKKPTTELIKQTAGWLMLINYKNVQNNSFSFDNYIPCARSTHGSSVSSIPNLIPYFTSTFLHIHAESLSLTLSAILPFLITLYDYHEILIVGNSGRDFFLAIWYLFDNLGKF